MRPHGMINEGRLVKELCHQQVHFADEGKNKEKENFSVKIKDGYPCPITLSEMMT